LRHLVLLLAVVLLGGGVWKHVERMAWSLEWVSVGSELGRVLILC
jgi:hypothetical protein